MKFPRRLPLRFPAQLALACSFAIISIAIAGSADGQTKTWDGRHDTSHIQVTVAYFVPADRQPLADWNDRVDYYCKRIKQFHEREFQDQSTVEVTVHPTPVVSKWTTKELRRGDGDAIFFRTLQETDRVLEFAKTDGDAFPILLVLSDINHRPLDDFYRLTIRDGRPVFEGNLNRGNHFPGSSLGGARATYLADRGVGWGLVSADGWRVPYRGSDCVIYHEGLGHTVGLPHPEPGNASVMSGAQYVGWLSESWIDDDQKQRLGWKKGKLEVDGQTRLFNEFRAIPQPAQPRPGQPAQLKIDLPQDAKVKSFRLRYQTSIDSPWIESPQANGNDAPDLVTIGTFQRPTPISYRVDVETNDGTAEIWGYLQVRDENNQPPLPLELKSDLHIEQQLAATGIADPPGDEIDLLEKIDPSKCFKVGQWSKENGYLQSSKGYGVRIELPYTPPPRYRMTVIVQPLDKPNGLLLGLRSGDRQFVSLLNYASGSNASTALENVDGRNVGNDTTYVANLFKPNRLSQVITTVHDEGVRVEVDGRVVIDWQGKPEQLSLSDYWKVPNQQSLFLGTYECAYRFHRITIEPL